MATQTNLETFAGGFAKILENQWHGDVRLRATNTDKRAYITAHKLVLAARSKVFRLMFESDEFKTSAKLETVTLSEMRHEEVEAFVEFIYSDGSKLSAKGIENVQSLFMAAHKYEILHLQDLCRTELISSLDSTNALEVYMLSFSPFDKVLRVAVKKFILRNFKIIINTKEFELFAKTNPVRTVAIVRAVVRRGVRGDKTKKSF